MTRTLRAGALTAAALSLMFALAGCVGPTPTPTPSSTPTKLAAAPSPTPTPQADPLDDVVALVARPRELELRAADGAVVVALDYRSSAANAIALLTDLLDSPPVDEAYPGGNHNAPGILHAWSDALVIDEHRYEDVNNPTADAPRFSVYFDAATLGDLDLTTSTQVHAGDTFDSLGDQIDPDLWTCSGWAVEFVEVPSSHSSTPDRIGVGLSEWEWDESAASFGSQVDYVVSIVAPVSVAGGCV